MSTAQPTIIESAQASPAGVPITPDTIRQLRPHMTPDEWFEVERLISEISLPPMPFDEFVREAWHVVEPHVPYMHNWHIDAITDHLQAVVWGQIKNLIINIPPRHMKSTLVSVMWQPWVWTFRPWSQWLFFSYSRELSTRDNTQARRILRSPWYRQNFGHVFDFVGDQNLKTSFKNDQGGHRIARGVHGSTGEGGDFIVGDDLLAAGDRHSDAKRGRANDFWSTTVATRRNNPKTAATVIICQRLHAHDIVGYLQEKQAEGGEQYEMLVIPAEHEQRKKPTMIGWQDPRKARGDLLWPGRFPRKEIDLLKQDLGGEQAAAQLQQRPSPAQGQIFKVYWLKFWQPAGSNLPPVRLQLADGRWHAVKARDLPHRMTERIQSWDMAFKGTDHSSFVCGQVWGRDRADRYLLDQVHDRLDFTQTLQAVLDLTSAHPKAKAKLVEDKANGPAVINTLKRQIPGLIPVSPMGDKVARAHAVTPAIEAGNVYLPHPHVAPWVSDLIAELTMFPNSPNNDQVDALTQALTRFDSRKVARAR